MMKRVQGELFYRSFDPSCRVSQPVPLTSAAEQPSLVLFGVNLDSFLLSQTFSPPRTSQQKECSSYPSIPLVLTPFRSFSFHFPHRGFGAGFIILIMAETIQSLYCLFFKCWGTSGLYFGHEERGRCSCPQNFCPYRVCPSFCCIFAADTFSYRGRIYYSTSLLCASAGSWGKFGLFSMQSKHCLKRSHGLDNNFSNKFNTLISLGWR